VENHCFDQQVWEQIKMAGLHHCFSGIGFSRECSEVAIILFICPFFSSMANKKNTYQGYLGLYFVSCSYRL